MDSEEYRAEVSAWQEGVSRRVYDERADELRRAVGKAISNYVEYVTGDGYVMAWVAGADTTTPFMVQNHKSFVQPISMGDTSAAHVRGIADTLREMY